MQEGKAHVLSTNRWVFENLCSDLFLLLHPAAIMCMHSTQLAASAMQFERDGAYVRYYWHLGTNDGCGD